MPRFVALVETQANSFAVSGNVDVFALAAEKSTKPPMSRPRLGGSNRPSISPPPRSPYQVQLERTRGHERELASPVLSVARTWYWYECPGAKVWVIDVAVGEPSVTLVNAPVSTLRCKLYDATPLVLSAVAHDVVTGIPALVSF